MSTRPARPAAARAHPPAASALSKTNSHRRRRRSSAPTSRVPTAASAGGRPSSSAKAATWPPSRAGCPAASHHTTSSSPRGGGHTQPRSESYRPTPMPRDACAVIVAAATSPPASAPARRPARWSSGCALARSTSPATHRDTAAPPAPPATRPGEPGSRIGLPRPLTCGRPELSHPAGVWHVRGFPAVSRGEGSGSGRVGLAGTACRSPTDAVATSSAVIVAGWASG
jgi:hypothetical protein